jgi:hypothetical protein
VHLRAYDRELDSGSLICAVSSSGRFIPIGLHQQRYEHRQWCHTGILLSPHIDAIKQDYAAQQLQRQRGSEAAQITTAQTSYRRLLRHRNMLHLAALASIHSTTASTTAATASTSAAANDSSTDDDNEGSDDVSGDVAQLQTDEDAQSLAEAAEAAGVQPVLTLLQHYSVHTAAQRYGMRSLARLASASRSALLQVYSAGGVAAAVHALRLFQQQPEAASGSGARVVCVDFAAAETASACQESACWLLALLSQEALAARAVHAAGGCAALCSVIQTCLK